MLMVCSQGLVVCNLSISYLPEAGSTIRITKVNTVASLAIIDDQNTDGMLWALW
jgi:hypothetical protein